MIIETLYEDVIAYDDAIAKIKFQTKLAKSQTKIVKPV